MHKYLVVSNQLIIVKGLHNGDLGELVVMPTEISVHNSWNNGITNGVTAYIHTRYYVNQKAKEQYDNTTTVFNEFLDSKIQSQAHTYCFVST